MKMVTPPENQGQIVEVSYGWWAGNLYCLVRDRSDRTESWYVADEEAAADLDETWDPANGPPRISDDQWTACEDPDTE